MKLHQVRKDLLINLDRVIRVEIEPANKYFSTVQVRWHMQGNCSHVQADTFKDHAAALEFVMGVCK